MTTIETLKEARSQLSHVKGLLTCIKYWEILPNIFQQPVRWNSH